MAPATLAELVCAIDEGLVSGKIGKQVLPMLLQVKLHFTSVNLTNDVYHTGGTLQSEPSEDDEWLQYSVIPFMVVRLSNAIRSMNVCRVREGMA